MAKRCERELYDILIRTETACINQEPEIDFGNIPDADTKNDQVFGDLLVEAFTPIVQMNFKTPAIDHNNPTPQSNIIATNVEQPEVIPAKADTFADEHLNDCSEADYEGQLPESDFSCDEIDEDDENYDELYSSRTQSDNLEIGDFDHQHMTEATSSTELLSKRGRGRPRTKPRKNPNEIRKVGRPRTSPETRRKQEKRNYKCIHCEQIFDKLSEFVVSHQSCQDYYY